MKVEVTSHQLQRFLGLIPEDWKPCYNFRPFIKSLTPSDMVEFSLKKDFATVKLCADPLRACFIYNAKVLDKLKIKDNIIFTLEDSALINGFTSETLVKLRRLQSKYTPTTEFIDRYDSVEGWENIVFNLWPTLGFNHFKSVFDRIWKNKTYYCARDCNGIKELLIWDIVANHYGGYVLWSRDNCGDLSRLFILLHQQLATKNINNFYAYCNPNNKTSWNLHQLLGYKSTGHEITVYRPV